MDESMLEEMSITDGETEKLTQFFEDSLEKKYKKWAFDNPNLTRDQAPWYKMVRNTVW
jgi:hypothetical protein